MKILIVEDDAEISRLTAMYLDAEGFESKIINDGTDALAAIKSYHPDLVVLDLMLPGLSGLDICKQARLFYQGPILVLTACDDDVSEVSLLKFGADDFLNKPLKPHILVARIEALIRRSSVSNPELGKPQDCKLQINSVNREVFLDGKILILTDSEYEMLHLLGNNVGKIVSRDDCCRALRGIDYDFNDRSIDMRISALRKKLNDDKMPYKIITTVRNKGYMLLNG
jgi:DNA-binding response OmpR family regulator